MHSGSVNPLIVMNGVSHEDLFKTSRPPGETELKERSHRRLKCFHTIVEVVKNKKGPPSLNLLERGMSQRATKDNRGNHRNALHPVYRRSGRRGSEFNSNTERRRKIVSLYVEVVGLYLSSWKLQDKVNCE